MNPKFEQLINALKEGDLDKVVKVLFSITRISEDPSEERYEFAIPGRPLFLTGEITEIENNAIKEITIDLHYPGWVLRITARDNEQKMFSKVNVYQAQIEGVYIRE